VREIRTLGLMRRGLETGLWWRYWGTPVRKRGATDRRNLRSRASPRPYLYNHNELRRQVKSVRDQEELLASEEVVDPEKRARINKTKTTGKTRTTTRLCDRVEDAHIHKIDERRRIDERQPAPPQEPATLEAAIEALPSPGDRALARMRFVDNQSVEEIQQRTKRSMLELKRRVSHLDREFRRFHPSTNRNVISDIQGL
jgi:hypothetical protein